MPDENPLNSINVTLRPLTSADFPRLVEWINAPHVARWWDGKADLESIKSKYDSRLSGDDKTRVFVIELDTVPIGMIQCYRHDDNPDWDTAVGVPKAAGIDYLIGEVNCTGKGVGVAAIHKIVELVFSDNLDIDFVVSVPQADNRRSCRVLEKAGFNLMDTRKVASDCPSDAGISAIYVRQRISG